MSVFQKWVNISSDLKLFLKMVDRSRNISLEKIRAAFNHLGADGEKKNPYFGLVKMRKVAYDKL